MAETPDPAVQKSYTSEVLVGALILGLIVGVFLSWAWFGSKKLKTSFTTSKSETSAPSNDAKMVANVSETSAGTPSSASLTSNIVSTTETPSETSSDMLVINDQPAGLTVAVTKANVTDDEWVVIHEDRMGAPSNALGAARFVAGATSGTVELLRGTSPGVRYHGLIYKDDGDRIFSMERDIPLRDQNGNPIAVSFTTN